MLALIGCASIGMAQVQTRPAVPEGIWVRPGYELTMAADKLPDARLMAVSPDGTLYVSIPEAGQIKACRDSDKDGYYETVTISSRDRRRHTACAGTTAGCGSARAR